MKGKLKTAVFAALAGLIIGGAIAVLLAGLIIGAMIGIGLALMLGLGAYWKVKDAGHDDHQIEDGR